MYYSKGNYEAFAKPRKIDGVEDKAFYLVGSGLASLSAAAFLIRDGYVKGNQIHIFEELNISGGACDGILDPHKGFIIRGGREMEDHFECLWDLYRSIPSLEVDDASVLDEFYWLNKDDPNYSLERVIEKQGQDAKTNNKFNLNDEGAMEVFKLFMMKDELLYDKKIEDVLDEEFFKSNFWIYWQTMFAFETWHSALEMKLYLQRFIHHIDGLPDLSALKFTKYNQYESLILPLMKYLEKHGVDFVYDTEVLDVIFKEEDGVKYPGALILNQSGDIRTLELDADDYVIVTNGSCTENSSAGDHYNAPVLNDSMGGAWRLWTNIAKQGDYFGRPKKFCGDIEKTIWESATITVYDVDVADYIQRISKRDPYSGKVVTGGIVTVKDSNWLMSYTLNRQPHFKKQPKDQLVVWVYGLYINEEGNYVKKSMRDCTGKEIAMEWLYHIGVEEELIEEYATDKVSCVPVLLPYITAFFMPRTEGDRPDVVPCDTRNFAFIGQFAQTPRDTVFTTEYSVRTAMEAVYQLLNIERGVPEVFSSKYDVRCLLKAASSMRDGKKITDMKVPFILKVIENNLLKKFEDTEVVELLKENNLI